VGEQFFPKILFALSMVLSPISDILTYSIGGYGREEGVHPHAKGEGEDSMWITYSYPQDKLLPHPSCVDKKMFPLSMRETIVDK
jgi:hypothetical protein